MLIQKIANIYYKSKKTIIGGFLILFIIVLGVFAFIWAQEDPFRMEAGATFEPPSKAHFFGTDNFGRCTFSRCLYGIQTSMVISLFITACSLCIGVFLGTLSSYIGGFVDEVLSSIADILFSIPTILLAMFVATLISPGLKTVVISLIISYTPQFFRVTRGSVLSVLHTEYIESAKSLGAGNFWIIIQHVLPNASTPILINASLTISFAILNEAGLSFIGLGTQPPTPSLGLMLKQGLTYLYRSPYLAIFSGFMIFICVLAFNLFGDGLRELLDPYLRGKEI